MWKGVLIGESLVGPKIPSEIKIVHTKVTTLEDEEEKGQFHFHTVTVTDENRENVVEFISKNIKEGWYFHLVKNGEMIVIFRSKVWHAHKGNQQEIEKIRNYALSQEIIAEQLPLEKLFDNPYL